MLSISSGHSAEYLTGQVAQGRENYYLDATTAGEPPGQWSGAGAQAFGLVGEVDNDVMTAVYGEFRDPRDPKFADPSTRDEAATLGRAPGQYKTEEQMIAERLEAEPGALPERVREIELDVRKKSRKPVMFIDATFSPVKSFTVLHTALQRAELDAQRAGDHERAAAWAALRAEAEASLWAGNQAMLSVLSDRAGFSRTGRHGAGAGKWTDAHDWTVASFHQSDSRDHDPQQHVHNAILNRVVCPDGEVRSLDSRAIHAWKQSAGGIGERVMEEELSRRLGVRWVMRADGQGREIEGIDQAVMDLFSERSGHINRTLAARVSAFEQTHGRAPSALELSRMRQQAALGTRRSKTSAGETAEARLDRWDKQLRAEVAGGLSAVAAKIHKDAKKSRRPKAGEFSPSGVVAEAVDACQTKSSAFSRSELERQIALRLPALGGMSAGDVTQLVTGLADTAITDLVAVTGAQPGAAEVPAELRLSTGESVYAAPGSVRYATRGHMRAEEALRQAAIERGRYQVPTASAAGWLGVRGHTLGQDQAVAVRGLLTSGAAVSVLVGPAGTGKSHTVGAFADAWSQLTGSGRVFGLATSQIATEVLIEDGVAAMNTTRWETLQDRLDDGTAAGDDETWKLGGRDIVVIDESSMVDTAALQRIRDRVDAAGARLVLTGDPRQLAAVGAGGAMDLVSGDHGADVYTLAEVRRFTHSWESDASLQLRDADPAAVMEYDRRGRVIDAGTVEQAGHRAGDAYLGETLAGRSSLIVTASNQQAAKVSGIVRDKLVELGRVDEHGVLLDRDGNTAGVGDLVQARRNDWPAGLVNRRRYRVMEVGDDGSLEVAREDDPTSQHTMTADYVRENVTLGYAATAHSAQGVTVDTAQLVVSAQTTAESLYVGMSRGRESNTAFVVTIAEPPAASTGEIQAAERQEPTTVLTEVLERADGNNPEAAALAQAAADARQAGSMHTVLARREDAVRMATRSRLEAHLDQLAVDDVITGDTRTALAADQGSEQLSRLMRAAEQAGHSPAEVLREAAGGRDFDNVRSPAQVLHARVRKQLVDRLSPDETAASGVPSESSAEWHTYMSALDEVAADRRRALGTEAAAEAPGWAVDAIGQVPEDAADRVEWEHRAGVVAAYREATGWAHDTEAIGPAPGLSATERRAAWHEAWTALGRPDTTPEEHGLGDGALRNRVAAWQRAQEWAPADVYAEMRETGQQALQRRHQAAVLDARADAETDSAEADRLRDQAEHERLLAKALVDVEEGLDTVANARAEWIVDTAVMQDMAARAEAELSSRGKPIGGEPDRTTADEWLEAQRASQAADEADRVVSELDVAEADRRAAELDVVDERSIAQPRATATDEAAADIDRTAPELPKGVPSQAELAAHTSAAAAALDRLAADRAADAARHADEASQQQAALEASREHYYRERARAALEAAEFDAAPVWEK